MSSNFLLAGWLAFKVIDHKAYSYEFLQSTGLSFIKIYGFITRILNLFLNIIVSV